MIGKIFKFSFEIAVMSNLMSVCKLSNYLKFRLAIIRTEISILHKLNTAVCDIKTGKLTKLHLKLRV
jgi:hypothetical protein